MPRNNAIDAVKGFAILLVMIGHCIVLNGLNQTDPYIYDAIKSVQMPLFMAVSGALTGMSYARKQSVSLHILKKRAISYLIPFFSWFIVVFLVTHIVDGTIGVALFFTELIALLFQTDRGLWFLTTLYEVTVAVTVSQCLADHICLGNILQTDETAKLNKRNNTDKKNYTKKNTQHNMLCKKLGYVLVFMLFFYLLFFLQARSGFLFLSPSLAVQYMPFYALFYLWFGYKDVLSDTTSHSSDDTAKEGKNNRMRLVSWIVWSVCLIVFVYMVVFRDLNKAPEGVVALVMQMLTSLMGCYVCFFGVYEAYAKYEQKNNNRKKKEGRNPFAFLPWIGQYTLEIYVLHFRFARLLNVDEKNINFYSLEGIGYLIATFVLMSICTALCIFFFKKSRVLNKLLFGK